MIALQKHLLEDKIERLSKNILKKIETENMRQKEHKKNGSFITTEMQDRKKIIKIKNFQR